MDQKAEVDQESQRKAFRDWLLEQMRIRRWNQSELARRSGTTPAMISKYVLMQNFPSEYGVERIARALSADEDMVRVMVGLEPRNHLPESSRTGEIIGMVKRVDWSDDVKFNTVSGILRMYTEEPSTQEGESRRYVQRLESP